MAGHSKWGEGQNTSRVAIDAKRGKIFRSWRARSPLRPRQGGGDPDLNARLRMALLKCRAANMPKDNIDRAIAKATGSGEGSQFEEFSYEIYGPHGVAMLVPVSTDNRNRTASEIRSLVTKAGGSIATAGAVSRLFQRKGQLIVPRDAVGEDQLMELALEAGAEDFKADADGYEIITEPAQFEAVHKAVESKGIKCAVAEVTELPTTTVPLANADAVVRRKQAHRGAGGAR